MVHLQVRFDFDFFPFFMQYMQKAHWPDDIKWAHTGALYYPWQKIGPISEHLVVFLHGMAK